MTPEEIIDAYNVLAQDVQDQTAIEAARIGNAQRSLGPLAAAVASPSGQTSGLANYTYDRTLRPTVDTLTTSLITTGKANALENKLKSDLRAAKNAYEDAKNAYTVASTTPSNNGNGNGDDAYKEVTDTSYSGEQLPYVEEGTIVGVGGTGTGGYRQFDVVIADGKGGTYIKHVTANSQEEARQKSTIIGTSTTGNGTYDIIFSDGSKKTYIANSADEAKRKYYQDKY